MEPSSSSDRIRPLAALHVLQALVFAAVAVELSRRWAGDAALFGLAAGAQLVAAGARGRARVVRVASLASLIAVLLVYGRLAATALHIWRVFGPLTGKQALTMAGTTLAAVPWLLTLPVARALPLRAWSALAIFGLLPALGGTENWTPRADPAALSPLATALWDRWNDRDLPLPSLPADATVRLTPLRAGVPGEARQVVPAKALAAIDALEPPGPGDALVVDLLVAELPLGLARPGVDGPRKGRSPVLLARDVAREEVLPGFFAPVARGRSARYASALVSVDGVVPLARGWAPGPEPTAEALDDAVAIGVAHLVAGMGEDGRFTYIVKGPSGEPGRGYNYPRHAGTAWFLARAAAATGSDVAAMGTDRALAHLRDVTRRSGERGWVLDPARDDGKAWIGTTGLATAALALRGGDPELLRAWALQLAASVDDEGRVRGDMDLASGTFPEQPANAYGQGQVMLGLAAAERAGIDDGRAALDRAIRYVEGGYVGTAHPIRVPDEHWMCLAAHAIREVRGVGAGDGICAAYVADFRWDTPRRGAGLPPAAGAAAGGAEALAARAWGTGDEGLAEDAVDWARHFLASQYRAADAPFLKKPAALIGGFRNTLGELDVQIDTVQHIGCALLGVEALTSGRARPGSWP